MTTMKRERGEEDDKIERSSGGSRGFQGTPPPPLLEHQLKLQNN